MGAAAAGLAVTGATLLPSRAAHAGDLTEPSRIEPGLTKFKDPLRFPPILRPRRDGAISRLTVPLRNASVRLHSELPKTPMWTYGGHFPGPVIEVRSGQRTQVAWQNELTGTLPVVPIQTTENVPGRPPGSPPENYPGRDGFAPLPELAGLTPWLAVHLHGSRTGGNNDGWAENLVGPGAAQVAEYANEQRATTLWYHDHTMHASRATVLSGLVGMYLIRDEEEEDADLPRGQYEVPLILTDANFDLDAEKKLTGGLLHKISVVSPVKIIVPFRGPFNLVNGVIWPYYEVKPRGYRLRILNASTARIYRLVLLDQNNQPVNGAMKLIGTDQGLLREPLALPNDQALELSPAERADILIDFGAFAGRTLKLVNTYPGNPPGEPDPDNHLPEPDIMKIRVGGGKPDRFVLPTTVAPSFVRLNPGSLPEARRRWVVMPAPFAALGNAEMWEMEEVDPADVTIPSAGVIQIRRQDGEVVTLRRLAMNFDESTHYFAELDGWEVWNFLNFGGPPHPMHIHLMSFQVLNREFYNVSTFDQRLRGSTAPFPYEGPSSIAPHEQGWKDVVRVDAIPDFTGELVTVAGQFRAVGRFAYHCHTLDHENMGMMRSFVVMTPELLRLHHGGGHHHG